MYCVRDNKVEKIEIVKENKRCTGAWCKFEGVKKPKLVSYSKMFETKEEANKCIKDKNKSKALKNEKAEKEFNEKQKIAFEIMNKTGIKIPLLTYANSSIEELKDYYRRLVKEKK